jgi:hypothetical protein
MSGPALPWVISLSVVFGTIVFLILLSLVIYMGYDNVPDIDTSTSTSVTTLTDSYTPVNATGQCSTKGTTFHIAGNHGHVLTIPTADVVAGTKKVYVTQGTSTHSHTIILTPADFAKLKANNGVLELTTTNSGHRHTIVVNCSL